MNPGIGLIHVTLFSLSVSLSQVKTGVLNIPFLFWYVLQKSTKCKKGTAWLKASSIKTDSSAGKITPEPHSRIPGKHPLRDALRHTLMTCVVLLLRVWTLPQGGPSPPSSLRFDILQTYHERRLESIVKFPSNSFQICEMGYATSTGLQNGWYKGYVHRATKTLWIQCWSYLLERWERQAACLTLTLL